MESPNAETTPLLGKQWRSRYQVSRYLTQIIRVQNAYLPLLVCCFITGVIDAGSYNAWSVFMGMQTGMLFHIADNELSMTIPRQHHLPGLEHGQSTGWRR